MNGTEFIDETGNAPLSAEVESIWLTRTSVKPIWLAAMIGVTLIGLFAFWPALVIGAIASIGIVIAWIGESRDENDELPLS